MGACSGAVQPTTKAGIAIGMYTLKLLRELDLIDQQKYAVILAGV